MIKAIKAKDEAQLRMATIAHIRESLDEISNYVAIP
jgi:DNA-binding GntR family transcriptional regulator